MKTYNVKQVAEMLNTNPETVRRWIRQNKLKASKSSNKGGNVIAESALNAFLKSMPKYAATSAASLATTSLLGGAALSSVLVGSLVAGKVLDENALKNAKMDISSIKSFIRNEISSRRKTISLKKKSIEQIEKEIADETYKINDLKNILQQLNNLDSK